MKLKNESMILDHIATKTLTAKWEGNRIKQCEILNIRRQELAEQLREHGFFSAESSATYSLHKRCSTFGQQAQDRGLICDYSLSCLWCWSRKIKKLITSVRDACVAPATHVLFIAQDLTYLPADVHHPIERQLLGDRAICFVASKYAHVDTVIALLPPETVSLGDATATWFDVAIEDCYEDSVPGVCPSHRRLSAMVISGPPPDISRLKFPSAGWFAFELVPGVLHRHGR